jgi:hypothetical protein
MALRNVVVGCAAGSGQFCLVSHPRPVRQAIERYRRMLDGNPFATVEHGMGFEVFLGHPSTEESLPSRGRGGGGARGRARDCLMSAVFNVAFGRVDCLMTGTSGCGCVLM